MNLIIGNPYRQLGLLVGATRREQEKQTKRLKQYIIAQKTPDNDFSFPSLINITRTEETVSEAASKLSLDRDKIEAALFWFYMGSDITDEPAFEALKAGNTQKAIDIWARLVDSQEITQRNASAYSNLSTILLLNVFSGHQKIYTLKKPLALKLAFLDSEFAATLKEKASDETFKITNSEMEIIFLSRIQAEINNSQEVSMNQFVETIINIEYKAKKTFHNNLIDNIIKNIEDHIDETKNKTKQSEANILALGTNLYSFAKDQLTLLKKIVGNDNARYAPIADKTANEVLQCGITHFNKHKKMGGNTAGLAIDLCKQAEGLAVGNIAKQRCRENINGLQDWVNDKPTRDKESRVAKELEQLMLLVDEYSAIHDTVKTSVSSQALAIYSFLTIPDNSYYKTMAVHSTKLLLAAKPYLNTIKYVLGSSDKLYIATSSDIASIAQGIYIAELNELCSLLEVYKDNRNFIILLFQKCLEETKKSMLLIEKMDLDPSFQARYLKNKQNIIGDGGNKDSGSGGCLVIIAMIIVFFLIYLLK